MSPKQITETIENLQFLLDQAQKSLDKAALGGEMQRLHMTATWHNIDQALETIIPALRPGHSDDDDGWDEARDG